MRLNLFSVEKSKGTTYSFSPEQLARKRITFSESENDSPAAAAEVARRKRSTWAKAIHGKGVCIAIKDFFTKLPTRLWQFFITAFLIPHYRPEWGKYSSWQVKKYKATIKNRILGYHISIATAKSSRPLTKRHSYSRQQRHVTDIPPAPVEHDHSECTIVRINVSGEIFEPQLRTLRKFPKTLLGNPQRMVQFYDPERNEFFFDRHRSSFEAIMYYYISGGILRRPSSIAPEIFLDEIKFYDLGPEVVSGLTKADTNEDENRPLPKNLLQRKIWLLFEFPESSYQSRIVAYMSIFVVCLSIFEFCTETLPTFAISKFLQVTSDEDEGLGAESDDETLNLADPFFLTESICIVFFVVEYIIRAATCPHFFNFVKAFSNMIDLIAIMPYFLNLLYYLDDYINGNSTIKSSLESKAVSLTAFRIIRLVRVFRILKLSRHNRGLKILGRTLKASSRELGLLAFFLMVGVMVFSSVMYFAEAQYKNTPFTSIPQGFWFGVVTMTTLGYGDVVPVGPYGKIIGALCAIAGVLTISLPVPVIVSNFNMFYSTEDINNSQSKASKNSLLECDHVEHCPYYPGCYSSDGQVLGDQLSDNQDGDTETTTVGGKSSCARWLLGELREDTSDSEFDALLAESKDSPHHRKMKRQTKSNNTVNRKKH